MGTEASPAGKVWNVLNGLGSMAFAVEFGIMTLEVQVRNYSSATCLETALYMNNKNKHWPKLATCGASLSLQGGPVLSHILVLHVNAQVALCINANMITGDFHFICDHGIGHGYACHTLATIHLSGHRLHACCRMLLPKFSNIIHHKLFHSNYKLLWQSVHLAGFWFSLDTDICTAACQQSYSCLKNDFDCNGNVQIVCCCRHHWFVSFSCFCMMVKTATGEA